MNDDNMGLASPSEIHERNLTDDDEGYIHRHHHLMPETRLAENRSIGDRAVREQAYEEDGRSNATKTNPSVQSGPAGPPRLDKYANTFWSPQMAPLRKVAFKILVPSVTLLVIVIWIFLPIYWGSLWKSNKYTDKLAVRIIDRDGGAIGSAVSEGLLNVKTLGFFVTPPSELPTEADVEHDIVQEGAWGSLVISEGATAALEAARASGDSSYSGALAINFYYAQARNEQAAGLMVPLLQTALGQILGKLNAQLVAQYIGQNANNATAMQLLAQAPTTVSNGVAYTMRNLRPFNQPVATAITLVGLIYLLIFSFFLSMINNAVREIIGPFLTTSSYIQYRIFTLMILYLIVALFISMINLPFKINFGAHFTYAGGYFLWYFVTFLGMTALGLAIEFVFTIVGVKFVPFFLIMWIIVNVSTIALPHELQPWIYGYAPAMPFYNVSRIVRTIIFDTKNTIGANIGVLLGWIGLSLITIPLATWATRRKAVNEYRASKAAEGEKSVVV